MSTIKSALRAAVEGTFFPEWEFQTLFGLDRQDVKRVYDAWPTVEFNDETHAAVTGALGHLLGYPHSSESELRMYVKGGSEPLRTTLQHYTVQFLSTKERH